MFNVATKLGGTCNAFPDVCKTPTPVGPPPIPIPYPNVALLVQANPLTCSKRVKIMNQAVVLRQSVIPMSLGDEPGTAGGVVSNTFKGPVQFKRGSVKVRADGRPVAFLTCMTGHNGMNANAPMGLHASPSQFRVFVSR